MKKLAVLVMLLLLAFQVSSQEVEETEVPQPDTGVVIGSISYSESLLEISIEDAEILGIETEITVTLQQLSLDEPIFHIQNYSFQDGSAAITIGENSITQPMSYNILISIGKEGFPRAEVEIDRLASTTRTTEQGCDLRNQGFFLQFQTDAARIADNWSSCWLMYLDMDLILESDIVVDRWLIDRWVSDL